MTFLSRKIDIKLCQIYTEIHSYKSSRFKQIIFNKYATNLKTTISNRSLRISGLLIIFAFKIDIIDNIIII